jgi:hypothetical protein
MSQSALDFGRSWLVDDARRKLVRACEDIVDSLGWDVAAGATGVRKQTLREGFDGRQDRQVDLVVPLALASHPMCPARLRDRVWEVYQALLGDGPPTVEQLLANELAKAKARILELERGSMR